MKKILFILSLLYLLASMCFGAAYSIATPFTESEIPNIHYAMNDNAMYLVSGTDHPQVLTRTAHNAWTCTDITMETGPFLPDEDTTTTITSSGTTGTITLTASSSIFDSDHVGSIWQISHMRASSNVSGSFSGNDTSATSAFFTGSWSFITTGSWEGTVTLQRSEDGSDWEPALSPLTHTNYSNMNEEEDDGAYYRVKMTNYSSGTCEYTFTINSEIHDGVVEITAVASGTSATATVITDLAKTTATKRWREGYWSDYRGWPKTVAFHQQRLVFGGSTSYPQALWFAKIDEGEGDDPTDFDEGTLDTDAFTVFLPGQNPIRWLKSGDYLFIGTSGSVGKYGEIGEAITPTSPNYREQSKTGCAAIQAILGSDSILYVERGNEKIRGFSYSLEHDKYMSPDLTILAEDITDSGIKEIAFQNRPQPIMWCVLNDGNIATMTYQRDHAVIGWSLQVTDGDFESVCVIPGEKDVREEEDEVWVVVKRAIDGTDYRYVEKFRHHDYGNADDAWYVDSGLDRDGASQASFSGLTHLEGETLQIYADAVVLADETVASGEITIDNASSRVIVGLPYTAKLETLPLSIDPQDKPYQKKIMNIWVDIYETGDLDYGMGNSSTLESVNFGTDFSSGFSTSHEALEKYRFTYGTMGKATVYFESEEPVPVTIRSIVPEVQPYKED